MSLYLSVGLLTLIFVPKGEVERYINIYHNPFLDDLFLTVTALGDGKLIGILIFVLFFIKVIYGLVGGISFLTSTIIVQTVKRFAFPDSPRPLRFFEPKIHLHYVDGLEIHSYFSFPSGHTAGAFTIFCLLAILTRNKMLGMVYFILAFMVGFSRMYLLQHFLLDTYFGALFGTLSTLLVFYILKEKTSLFENSRLDKPIYKLF